MYSILSKLQIIIWISKLTSLKIKKNVVNQLSMIVH